MWWRSTDVCLKCLAREERDSIATDKTNFAVRTRILSKHKAELKPVFFLLPNCHNSSMECVEYLEKNVFDDYEGGDSNICLVYFSIDTRLFIYSLACPWEVCHSKVYWDNAVMLCLSCLSFQNHVLLAKALHTKSLKRYQAVEEGANEPYWPE